MGFVSSRPTASTRPACAKTTVPRGHWGTINGGASTSVGGTVAGRVVLPVETSWGTTELGTCAKIGTQPTSRTAALPRTDFDALYSALAALARARHVGREDTLTGALRSTGLRARWIGSCLRRPSQQ